MDPRANCDRHISPRHGPLIGSSGTKGRGVMAVEQPPPPATVQDPSPHCTAICQGRPAQISPSPRWDPRSRRRLAIVEGGKRIELPHDEEYGRHIITKAEEVGTLATHILSVGRHMLQHGGLCCSASFLIL
jgi:hypothetical protein